jgi:hypothetical protein
LFWNNIIIGLVRGVVFVDMASPEGVPKSAPTHDQPTSEWYYANKELIVCGIIGLVKG